MAHDEDIAWVKSSEKHSCETCCFKVVSIDARTKKETNYLLDMDATFEKDGSLSTHKIVHFRFD